MEEIDGFSKAEYLITFLSIIIGFVVSAYFEGLGTILRRYQKFKNPLKYLFTANLTLFLLLIFWWNSWSRASLIVISIGEFLEIVPYAIIFYMITVVLFNGIHDGGADLRIRFERYRTHFWLLLLIYFSYDLFSTDLFSLNLFRFGGLTICLIGLVASNRWIQNLLIIIGYATIISYLYVDFHSSDSLNISDVGYSKVEHLTIFLSFVYGFVVTEFLKGWSRIMKTYRSAKISLIHLLWTLFTFLLLLDIWWGNWVLKSFIGASQFYYLLLMSKPFLLYMLTLYMFPRYSDHVADYWDYFLVYKRFIFPVFALVLFGNLLISIFFNLLEVELMQNLLRIGGMLVAYVAWKSRSTLIHYSLITISMCMVMVDFLFKSNVLSFNI
jgi:hypothetical protein